MTTTTINLPTRDEIVARAEQAEKLRRVPDETIADFKAAQISRICQPSRYGGFDHGWDVLCESVLELDQGDGSQAWVCCVFGEHACLVGHFSDEAQQDVWGKNESALISSSYSPGCVAECVSGGYGSRPNRR